MTSPWPILVTPLAPVSCGAVLWRRAGVAAVTVIVKATFGLVHEASARLVAPDEIVREDRYRPRGGGLDEASETAPYLPGAGVVLSGSAYAPGGQPVPAVSVRLGIFRERALVNKVLHVIGDRSPEAPGAPKLFRSMPILYERAFGGPGVEDNPVGTGAVPGSQLPNVVFPESPQRPGGFGPISRHWGPRRRLLGGADPRALEAPGAEIPTGFDGAWFHAAPADQRVEALHGDEWIVLDGLHPSLPQLRSRLPSARAHARFQLSGPGGAGSAFALAADTLIITPDSQRCSLIWRGHVLLEPAYDVSRMSATAGIEMAGYPLATALSGGAAEASAPSQPRQDAAPKLELPATKKRVDPLNQTVTDVTAKLQLPVLPFAARREHDGGSRPKASKHDPLNRTVDAVASPVGNALPFLPFALAGAPVPRPADPAPPQAPPEPPPETPAEPAPATALGAAVLARIKARESLLDLDLAGADLHDLDLTGAVLSRMNLNGAKLGGCKLRGARLAGARLVDADLTGADLSGADLGGADLSRATLAGTRFDGAVLTDGNLTGARGPGARFDDAKAARANFARGEWDQASFARADASFANFTATALSGARFEGATLVEVRLADARGPGAVFDGARLVQARAASAAFTGASFRDVDATGSVWEKATLDGADFAAAGLKQASLTRASCLGASFAGADLGGGNLQHVLGDGADFRAARLAGADLRQARLHDACFDGAVLRDLAAGKADFTRASFVRADLGGATLRGARLTGASFVHAELEGADLRDAELEGANVFGAARKTAKLGSGARGLVEVDPGSPIAKAPTPPDPAFDPAEPAKP